MTTIGVDIGGTHLRVAAGRPDDSPRIARASTPGSYPELISTVTDMAQELCSDPPSAVGVGLPGAVSDQRAVFIPALPFLDDRAIGAALQSRFNVTVRLANDAQCALLAEHRIGAAAGCSSAIMIVIGTGVGGAMLVNGRLYRGAHGTAGAFGWLPGASADPRHGAFERDASGQALDKLAATLGVSAADMFGEAEAGRQRFVDAAASYGYTLGRGLAAIVSIWDPELVIVGGVVAPHLTFLTPSIRQAIRDCASPPVQEVPIVSARLGVDAGVIGALCLAEDEMDCRP